MTPEVIGYIGLQKLFGKELHWPTTTDNIRDDNHICNIEANFGREPPGEERYQKAKEALKVSNQILLEIGKKN